jgi:hypothetical protein
MQGKFRKSEQAKSEYFGLFGGKEELKTEK